MAGVDPRLPVTVSAATVVPGQGIGVAVTVSDELARRARVAEAALYYVVTHDTAARVIVVADRKELARDGDARPGTSHALLTVPLDAPASTTRDAVEWYAGAAVVCSRGPDVRSFVPLTVLATPDPTAPSANAEPDRQELAGNKRRGGCALEVAPSSRDVPLGGAFEGAVQMTPWTPDGAPYGVMSVRVELKCGPADTDAAPRKVARQRVMGEATLASGATVELPFRLPVPADADPTSDPPYHKPLGWIMRGAMRLGDGVYDPERIRRPEIGSALLFAHRWWIVATVQSQLKSGRGAETKLEVRVHNAAAGAAPAGWYADPGGGGWRWWDGVSWTEHTSAP